MIHIKKLNEYIQTSLLNYMIPLENYSIRREIYNLDIRSNFHAPYAAQLLYNTIIKKTKKSNHEIFHLRILLKFSKVLNK